jgi:hypothetical protein
MNVCAHTYINAPTFWVPDSIGAQMEKASSYTVISGTGMLAPGTELKRHSASFW